MRPLTGPVSVGLAGLCLVAIAAFGFYTGFTRQLRAPLTPRTLRPAQVVVMQPAPPSQDWQPGDSVELAAETAPPKRSHRAVPGPETAVLPPAAVVADAAQEGAHTGEAIPSAEKAPSSDQAPPPEDDAPH